MSKSSSYSSSEFLAPSQSIAADCRSECLALLAAYPVALLHQLHGNNRDPDVMHACQESAPELRRLRQCLRHRSSSAAPSKQKKFDKVKQLSEVQHFFEMFSLRLDKKFRVRGGKGKRPPMIPQKIIYQLRNRLELLKDNQVTDPQRLDFFGKNQWSGIQQH